MEDPLASASSRVAAAWLVNRVTSAIAVGAPLYNSGAVAECVDIYADTISCCVAQSNIPPNVRDLFLDAVQRCEGLISISRKAWELRHALDLGIKEAASIADASRSPSPEPWAVKPSVGRVASSAAGWQAVNRASRLPRHAPSPGDHASRPNSRQRLADESSPLTPLSPSCCQLLALPEDVQPEILNQLGGCTLGALSGTCRAFRLSARAHAAELLRADQPSLFRGVAVAERSHARWPRALHSLEMLEQKVGPRPGSRRWADEWPALRAADSELSLGVIVDQRPFAPGGEGCIRAMLRHNAAGVSWMIDAGWSLLHASTCMALLAGGSVAIGHSIRERSCAFAASAHGLCDVLRQRACAISTAAPPTYASMDGPFGLAVADPGWLALLQRDTAPGCTFVTSAPLQAYLNPRGQPHEGTDETALLEPHGPVVLFVSARSGQGDVLRTLLQISPVSFALPPLATVTLVGTTAAGDLHDDTFGPIMRQCICVRVGVPY